MFQECINPSLIPILDRLVECGILIDRGFYLAGGTALAIQLGHRISVDLDFFTFDDFAPQNLLISLNESLGEINVINTSRGTLNSVINGEKVSFLKYPYKNIYPPLDFRGCPIADYRDIGASKLMTISQRGLIRDFYDLDAVIQTGISFTQIVAIMEEKYPTVKTIMPHIIRSIGYFEDADNEPRPLIRRAKGFSLLTDSEWNEIKQRFLILQKNALTQELGINPEATSHDKHH